MIVSRLITPVIILFFLSSCATLFGSRYNSLVIGEAAPKDALVLLDGKKLGEGPGKYKVRKREIQLGSDLHLINQGDTLAHYSLNRRSHPAYVIADLVVFGLGIFVDVPSGNIYRPYPRKFFQKP